MFFSKLNAVCYNVNLNLLLSVILNYSIFVKIDDFVTFAKFFFNCTFHFFVCQGDV